MEPRGKTGEIVEVFEDPVTRNKSEGMARLVQFLGHLSPLDGMEWWAVEFLDEIGTQYQRSIQFEEAK